ncbi:hypothetical protein DPMN_138014 [Dreissena polymorpha]|uniref:Uncharacterized protein n=1 Tax=Dreissena polymorpha TaxID=45954 RepID=A0A9D4G5U0_DREPO|nr:hypothetical protein DPMN_138014 [Dreissena polymorpha]
MDRQKRTLPHDTFRNDVGNSAYIIRTNVLTEFHKEVTCLPPPPPPEGHVFQQTGTVFKLIQDITKTNGLTKQKSPAPGWPYIIGTNLRTRKHVSIPGSDIVQATETIFELVKFINGNIFLTKFHDDRTANEDSKEKNAQPPCGYFHEDWIINVDSRMLTRNICKPSQHTIANTQHTITNTQRTITIT